MSSKVAVAALVRRNAPAYAEMVSHEGEPIRCTQCKELGHPSMMYYLAMPSHTGDPGNVKSGPYHKNCVDPEWLRYAIKIPGAVAL